jgi:hypothetical protein
LSASFNNFARGDLNGTLKIWRRLRLCLSRAGGSSDKEDAMDWVIIVHLITEAPNYTNSQSHYMANFTSEKLCTDAVAAMKAEFSKPTDSGAKVSVAAFSSTSLASLGRSMAAPTTMFIATPNRQE